MDAFEIEVNSIIDNAYARHRDLITELHEEEERCREAAAEDMKELAENLNQIVKDSSSSDDGEREPRKSARDDEPWMDDDDMDLSNVSWLQ